MKWYSPRADQYLPPSTNKTVSRIDDVLGANLVTNGATGTGDGQLTFHVAIAPK